MTKSIMTERMDKCYFCGSTQFIEVHHVFFGTNHKKADDYGLVVPLCLHHHRGQEGVHSKNGHELDMWLKKRGQIAFETVYPDENFLKVFGKNYL